MKKNCRVLDRVLAHAESLKISDQALGEVFDLVEGDYLRLRRAQDQALVEAQYGPELDDVAVVMDHVVNHVLDIVGEQVADALINRMMARGMDEAHLQRVLMANEIRNQLRAAMPGVDIQVTAHDIDQLPTRLRELGLSEYDISQFLSRYGWAGEGEVLH